MSREIDDLAKAFFEAIEGDQLEKVRELYAPDVEVWHNVTDHAQSREENLKLLANFAGRVSKRRYEVLSREFFPGGFVQRHRLHGELGSGQPLALHACLVVHVADGRISRLYEYLDSAAVQPAFAS